MRLRVPGNIILTSPSRAAAPPDPGAITIRHDGESVFVDFAGRWDVRTVMANEHHLKGLASQRASTATVDIGKVTMLDTIGAIAVFRVKSHFANQGRAEIVGAHGGQSALLDQISQVEEEPLPRRPRPTTLDRIADLGMWVVNLGGEARDLVGFFGELAVVYFRLMRHPRRIRLPALATHMQTVGINSMPIVGLLAFLIGIVLTFISGDQLQRFGAGIFIVNLVGIASLRELGILITAIIVAGRSGSAFTAEIGTMKINQEIDAMRTIGLDPMEVLVVPRTLALMLMLIPLGFFADMVMILGGAIMADLTLGIHFTQFVTQFQSSIDLHELWVGMIKTPFFAFVIAMVGCYHGLIVSGSAESVGQQTTQSVVQSIFLVITLDAIFAIVFSQVGW
jgi:phospholipid/cholesterol/gamma-HCH transport system permease protein